MTQQYISPKEQIRRSRIIDAAVRVFTRDGLSGASMRSIAKEAGITTGAIYPLFAGKEDIYAHLLTESLERLHIAVAKAAAPEVEGRGAVAASAFAFFDYYADRRFEMDLGLYLFGTEKITGLGSGRDETLNALLLQSLTVMEAGFRRLSPENLSADEAGIWACEKRNALFSALMGALMLSHTGRDNSIGTSARTVLEMTMLALCDYKKNNNVMEELCQ
jgi:TetR/AcrR family transcriptional regulator